uniref:Reverse transcriptase domain-containing protein n=1 Tax=Tanacetum cinerariifolium TaxID=118510 RepID=A0A699K0Z2_TANCI|nr:hypothetical protein [Tanacetum cinerariifolium]
MEKFFQIFQDLHFDISFADALLLMPKFASTIKSLLTNKDKLFELANILLHENCLAMLLKKILEKLGDPDKFLMPCDFPGMDTLELANRSITRPKGVVEDVFDKVGKFHFLTDFVVVDFKADPRVPLILGRSFLRTGRALIDVYGEEITLRVNDEAITFNLNQSTRYSSTYDDLSANRIDIIDVAREDGFFHNQSSTSGTLSSNTIPNPKVEIKAVTTRSGVAYEGPLMPTPKKVEERETEETTDKEQTNFQGSTAHIQPSVTLISEPDVLKTLPKPNIPYPSRLNDQKLYEKATNQMEKFFQIFQDFHFDITKIPLNENCSAMLLKKLPEKLGDPGKVVILCDFSGMDRIDPLLALKESSKTFFVKVGKFHFLTDFVVVDSEADPRVPLILGRSFLRTGHALIDVYEEEITLRVNDEAVTFNLNQSTRYSSTYDDLSVNRIDIIYVAREEYAQEILEEIDAYLKDESISSEINHIDCDPEVDICLIKKLLNDDPFQLPPMDLKQGEVVKAKSSVEVPLELELKELPSHSEYAYLEGADKLPVIISKDLKS